jgi:hypothetical protein
MVPSRALLVLLALSLAACGREPRPAHHMPPADPTQVVAGDPDYKQRRKTWFAERHRAPPEVDWKALEAANGRARTRARNALAPLAAAAGSRWTERGSDNLAGRMHAAAPGPDGTTLYAGSALGGVWRGDLAGGGWEPLGDNLYGGAHWVAVVAGAGPGDPDVIVAATDGGSIHRSDDLGVTWTVPSGLPSTVGVRRVIVPPDGSDTIFMLVRWWQGTQLRNAIYRSTDRGLSFSKSLGMLEYWGDVWAPRDGAGPLYALKQDTIQVSNDNGDTWVVVGTLPISTDGGELVGSEAGAPRLWALVESGGRKLYRSDDAGQSWSFQQDVNDYWGSLAASSVDDDLFAWGGVEVHVTRNGGSSFDIVNAWWEYYGNEADKLHADIPGIDVIPDGQGGETWYVSTDGGLFESDDGLLSVANLSLTGLRVSQYYSTHTSTANPLHVVAGAQDQGYQWADQPPAGPGTTLSFDQLISGDYGHLTSSDGDHDYLYTVYPGFLMIHVGEDNPSLYMEDFPAGETFGWMPTVTADPNDETAVFFCANRLWRYKKSLFSNTWGLSLHSSQDFAIDSGEHLTALEFSPLDSQRVYAATTHGRLWTSNDHGSTWTQSTSTGPSSHYFYGTAMVASALDVDTVYVGGSGYGGPAVYRSTDGGATFQPHGTGLPSTLVYGLAEAPDGSGAIFCATETSAYSRSLTDSAWVDITQDDAPVTIYWSCEAVASEGVIRYGTYGRGIWDYALDDPCDWEPYGTGQGGANVLALDSASATTMGQPMTFDVTGGVASATGFMLVSTAVASLPAKGGVVLVDPTGWLLLPVTADGSGEVHLPATLPVDPGWEGLPVTLQAVLADPGQSAGWAFSNGLLGELCL